MMGCSLSKTYMACTCNACLKRVGVYTMAEILSKILGKIDKKIDGLTNNHDLPISRFDANFSFGLYILLSLPERQTSLHPENINE